MFEDQEKDSMLVDGEGGRGEALAEAGFIQITRGVWGGGSSESTEAGE